MPDRFPGPPCPDCGQVLGWYVDICLSACCPDAVICPVCDTRFELDAA